MRVAYVRTLTTGPYLSHPTYEWSESRISLRDVATHDTRRPWV